MSNHAFTIVRNDDFWLAKWLAFYQKQGFKTNELTVLNNGDPITVPEGVNVIALPSPTAFEHNWLRDRVQEQQKILFTKNRVVVFAESDEFLVTDSGHSLVQVCDSLPDGACLRAQGYSPVQLPGEASYVGGSLLADRKYMFKTHSYDKTLISTVPLTWCKGFHEAVNKNFMTPTPGLFMIHMWMFDLEQTWSRIEARRAANSKPIYFGHDFTRDRIEEHFSKGFTDYMHHHGVPLNALKREIPESIKRWFEQS